MEFREYMKKDLQGICELINDELGYSVSASDLEDRIAQMQNDENYQIFIAFDGKSVVGFIGLYLGLAFEISGRVMSIIALAVSRKHQCFGIGTALVQKAESFGKAHYASTILVNSGIARIAAHRFYEKQGFYKKGYSFMKKLSDQ